MVTFVSFIPRFFLPTPSTALKTESWVRDTYLYPLWSLDT
jgi:hypothetical protein